ncbi:MAG: YraN family protein [Acidobacteriaceae bacterium]|nr:YraN family protein [Acidobacteriaceae bacterium]MBV9295988.1 YraN family protein [Acidobacteriaceae bacterium]MBV9766651.1 YraN family protein [Acidobacteriaceae bacterium]
MATRSAKGGLKLREARQLFWKLSDAARQFRERRTLTPDAFLGKRGEDAAHRYLRSAGLLVVARNYRAGSDSEVDIIARDGEVVVFVEVKSRASAEFGSPERAIGSEKQKHILRAARSYTTRAGIEWNRVRFDTISIVFTDPPTIVHQRDAFFDGRAI